MRRISGAANGAAPKYTWRSEAWCTCTPRTSLRSRSLNLRGMPGGGWLLSSMLPRTPWARKSNFKHTCA
eukprot:8708562-Pyramimonas_sp.AAC.1